MELHGLERDVLQVAVSSRALLNEELPCRIEDVLYSMLRTAYDVAHELKSKDQYFIRSLCDSYREQRKSRCRDPQIDLFDSTGSAGSL